MATLTPVAFFATHIEADLARSALEAAGIDAMISSDDAGGQRPHLAFSQGVAVLVREEDQEAAHEVLASESSDVKPEE